MFSDIFVLLVLFQEAAFVVNSTAATAMIVCAAMAWNLHLTIASPKQLLRIVIASR